LFVESLVYFLYSLSPARTPLRWRVFAALVVAHASAASQTTVEPVVSPSAYAPPVQYRSVFVDTPTGIEIEETDWKKANAAVGQFKRGHIDILRAEEAQAAAKPSTEPAQNATKNIAPYAGSTGVKP
jgi:hypothetical protein